MDLDSKKILVVDDEPALAELIGFEFELNGAKVFTAESFEQAVKIIKSKQPDIIISDMRMPGKNGLDLLKHVREQGAALPVIMMTGYSDVDSMESFHLGADDIFTKPVERKKLYSSAKLLCDLNHSYLNVENLPAPEQVIDINVRDILDTNKEDGVRWGNVGLFVKTELTFPCLDAIIQLNVKSDQGTLTLIGRVRFTRYDQISGVGLELIHLSGDQAPEVNKLLKQRTFHSGIPKEI